MNGVPIATPHELTYRVDWEVIAISNDQVTVRAKRAEVDVDPADSDGIPAAIEVEMSVRGTTGAITADVAVAKNVTPAVKVNALTALAELAYRDGKGDIIEYPFTVEPEPGRVEVCVGILKVRTFKKWFLEMAQFDFSDIERAMGAVAGSDNWFVKRRAGVLVMKELQQLLPELGQFDDIPYLVLHL